MIMNYRIIKTNIIDILAANSKNCFKVIGHQRQNKSADDTLGNNRLVQVYYSFSEFSKSRGRLNGPVQHDVTYRIELTVSAPAKVNKKVLNDPNSAAAMIASVLATAQEASAVADEQLDELYQLVYQILMDANYRMLNMPKGELSNKWIPNWHKNDPLDKGEYTVLTGNMFINVNTAEQLLGVEAVVNGDIQDVTINQAGDENEKTGLIVNNP